MRKCSKPFGVAAYLMKFFPYSGYSIIWAKAPYRLGSIIALCLQSLKRTRFNIRLVG